jgi:hypothetical protein
LASRHCNAFCPSESVPLDAISSTALHAYPPRRCKALLIGIGALGFVLGAASRVEAQSVPQILSVPANSTSLVPDGLKVSCTLGPCTGQPSPNCPVIQYGGVRTWTYSFIDNRVAFGIVTHGPNNKVLANNTHNGCGVPNGRLPAALPWPQPAAPGGLPFAFGGGIGIRSHHEIAGQPIGVEADHGSSRLAGSNWARMGGR